jgi:hypothetical protein
MNKFYITFGQAHVHELGRTTLDKDCVLEIEDEDFIHAVAWTERTFGREFANIHQTAPDLSFYPLGIIKLHQTSTPKMPWPGIERGAGKWIIVNTCYCPQEGQFYIDANGVIKEARTHEGTLRTIVRWEAGPDWRPKVTMDRGYFNAALFKFGSEAVMLPTNVANRIFKGLQEAGIEVEIKGG